MLIQSCLPKTEVVPILNSATKIHPLTSIRLFAALYVVFFHSMVIPGHWHFARHTLSFGVVVVSFFFFLSGYLLSVAYLRDQPLMTPSKFWKGRFARVYPLFLATLILDTPPLLHQRIINHGFSSAILTVPVTFLGNAFLIQTWVQKLRGLDNPNWSLSVEAFFYLLYPVIGAAIWKLHGKMLVCSALMTYLCGQLLVLGLLPYASLSAANLDIVKFVPIFHLSTFCLGIMLAKWQTEQAMRPDYQAPAKERIRLLLAAVAATFLLGAYFYSLVPFANIHDGLFAPSFAVLVWCLSQDGFKWLSRKWLVVVGESSFGLYLIHFPLIHYFQWLQIPLTGMAYLLYFALCLSLSVASIYCLEAPMRRLVTGWIGAPRRHLLVRAELV